MAFYGGAMAHHGRGARAAAAMALVAKEASEEGSAALVGMVHGVGEVEEEQSELGAGPCLSREWRSWAVLCPRMGRAGEREEGGGRQLAVLRTPRWSFWRVGKARGGGGVQRQRSGAR